MKNKVYLVGAGPGAADLITVRGREILRQADVVIYDYLVDKRILSEIKEGTELICCDKLGKKRYSDHFLVHNEKINQLVIKKVKEGKKVIRLKSGDPSIFSRTSQELEILVKEKIEFEVVPGVSAANAASCLSGIPLTDRRFSSSCIFVTGHEDPAKKESAVDWGSLINCGTIALYMAVENLEKIIQKIIELGKSPNTAIAIIKDVSLPTQKIITGILKDIVEKAKAQKITPPSIIIIGDVVKLERNFNWLRKSRRVLFTGLSPQRFFIKGTYFHLPLISIVPMDDYREFDNHLKNIREFDWIVFTSRFGVEYFFRQLYYIKLDSRKLNNIKIAAIGNSTRNRLLDFGVLADLTAKKESAQGLLKEFRKIDIKNKKIFLPRSDIADKGLTVELKNLGAKTTAGFAYKNIMPKGLPDLDLSAKKISGSASGGEFFDEIMFTSPSTVRNFKKRYKALPKNIKVRCIGEVTRKEALKQGLIANG